MKKLILYFLILFGITIGNAQSPIIIDHSCTDYTEIPANWKDSVRANIRVGYCHTSHGDQINDGMQTLKNYTPFGTRFNYTFSWSGNYPNNVIDQYWNLWEMEGPYDVGNGYIRWDGYKWAPATRYMLGLSHDRNVVMWAWCNEMEGNNIDNVRRYLDSMSVLETDYPTIKFIYMTAHNYNDDGATEAFNDTIRAYCVANNKILYDFADIESYAPNGSVNYALLNANDSCSYDSDGNGSLDKNWARDWITANPTDTLSLLTSTCDNCDHSHNLNCVLKGVAAWWMLARIAGWDGGEAAPDSTPTLTSISPTFGAQNQTLNVTFTGTKFYNGVSSVNVGSGISINSTTVNNSTQITANITISGSATAGTRNFYVTNSGGGGNSGNQTFTVKEVTTMTSGNTISSISGSTGDQKFYKITVPSGQDSIVIQMSGGTGDADLHVRIGSIPTLTLYDYRPYIVGNNEKVSVSSPTAGTWYMMINAYSTYSGASFVSTLYETEAEPTVDTTNWYISNDGNDDSSGHSESAALKTISALNSKTLESGDSIFFNKGDTFYSGLIIQSDGITITSYGTGNEPILNGTESLTGWVTRGTFYACYSATTIHDVFSNEKRQTIARTPNSGYETVASGTTTTLTPDDWTGSTSGTWTVRTGIYRFHVGIGTCTWNGTTFTRTSGYWYSNTIGTPQDGYGFYADGNFSALDTTGEWYYNSSIDTLYFKGDTSNITGSVTDYGIYSENSNIIVDGLDIQGYYESGIRFAGDNNNITIKNCIISNCWTAGIYAVTDTARSKGRDFLFTGNTISDCNDYGIAANYAKHGTISNNTLSRIGLVWGYTAGSSVIAAVLDSMTISGNRVDSCGGNAVRGAGKGSVIERNWFSNCVLRQGDMGAIYFSGGANNCTVRHNIVENVPGLADFVLMDNNRTAEGIYLDWWSSPLQYFIIDSNSVINCHNNGLEISTDAHHIIAQDNIFYGCGDYTDRGAIRVVKGDSTAGNVIRRNTICPDQAGARFFMAGVYNEGDIDVLCSTLDSNYYVNRYNETDVFESWVPGDYTWTEWKSLTGSESHSIMYTDIPQDSIYLFVNYSATDSSCNPSGTYETINGDPVSLPFSLPAYSSLLLVKSGGEPPSPLAITGTLKRFSGRFPFYVAKSVTAGGAGITFDHADSSSFEYTAGYDSLIATIGSGTNQCTIFGFVKYTTNSKIDSIVVDGVGGGKLDSLVVAPGSAGWGNSVLCGLYGRVGIQAGTRKFKIYKSVTSSFSVYGAISLFGVDQSNPFGSVGTNYNTNDSIVVSISNTSPDWVVSAEGNGYSLSHSVPTNQTIRLTDGNADGERLAICTKSESGSSILWIMSGSGGLNSVAVIVRAAL